MHLRVFCAPLASCMCKCARVCVRCVRAGTLSHLRVRACVCVCVCVSPPVFLCGVCARVRGTLSHRIYMRTHMHIHISVCNYFSMQLFQCATISVCNDFSMLCVYVRMCMWTYFRVTYMCVYVCVYVCVHLTSRHMCACVYMCACAFTSQYTLVVDLKTACLFFLSSPD